MQQNYIHKSVTWHGGKESSTGFPGQMAKNLHVYIL